MFAMAVCGTSESSANIVDAPIRAPATPPAKAPTTARLRTFICSSRLKTPSPEAWCGHIPQSSDCPHSASVVSWEQQLDFRNRTNFDSAQANGTSLVAEMGPRPITQRMRHISNTSGFRSTRHESIPAMDSALHLLWCWSDRAI